MANFYIHNKKPLGVCPCFDSKGFLLLVNSPHAIQYPTESRWGKTQLCRFENWHGSVWGSLLSSTGLNSLYRKRPAKSDWETDRVIWGYWGRSTVNKLPWSKTLSTRIWPWWFSTIAWAMARPRPVPVLLLGILVGLARAGSTR
jgi:hypothetical protein